MAENNPTASKANAGLDVLAAGYRVPLIRWFIRRGIDAHTAEDLAHEVFVRVGQRGVEEVDRPEAYLFRTASAVLIDRARRRRVRAADAHEPLDGLEIASGAPSPARVFEDRESLHRLAGYLNELPERTREIFLLNRLDRLSFTQLAVRYGIGVGSIEKHMAKALAHIRARFAADD